MPIHDWTRTTSGVFHHFHQRWISAIGDALNGGTLPADYFALAEQVTGGPVPDVVPLRVEPGSGTSSGGLATATVPPRVQFIARTASPLAPRPNRVVVRHVTGRVVAVIELISPGNKESRHALRSLIEKAGEFLRQGINLLIVDLFPPSARDPQGIHRAIWDEICAEEFELPADRRLTCVSYEAAGEVTAYIQPVAVGEALPEMPLFLGPGHYVPLALEATYQAAWAVFPAALRPALEGSVG